MILTAWKIVTSPRCFVQNTHVPHWSRARYFTCYELRAYFTSMPGFIHQIFIHFQNISSRMRILKYFWSSPASFSAHKSASDGRYWRLYSASIQCARWDSHSQHADFASASTSAVANFWEQRCRISTTKHAVDRWRVLEILRVVARRPHAEWVRFSVPGRSTTHKIDRKAMLDAHHETEAWRQRYSIADFSIDGNRHQCIYWNRQNFRNISHAVYNTITSYRANNHGANAVTIWRRRRPDTHNHSWHQRSPANEKYSPMPAAENGYFISWRHAVESMPMETAHTNLHWGIYWHGRWNRQAESNMANRPSSVLILQQK